MRCNTETKLKWVKEDGYDWAKIKTSFFDNVGFQKISPNKSNVYFKNKIKKSTLLDNRNLLNGSGVAVADIDNDGLVDLYFASLEGPNVMYKNLGNFNFKEITDEAGIAHEDYHSTGVTFADVDGDGDQDLVITSLTDKNTLYLNDGKGKFKIKQNSGLGKSKGSNTMTLADIDGDADLDLYITNYKKKRVGDIYEPSRLTHRNTIIQKDDSFFVKAPFNKHFKIIQTEQRLSRVELGSSDELYLNKGNGSFEKVKNLRSRFLDASGNPKGLKPDWGLSAKFQDLNNDLAPDLYVANDFSSPDRFWINQGNGFFKHIEKKTLPSMSYSSMGVDYSDINRDGKTDIFVTEMLSKSHRRRSRQLSQNLEVIPNWSDFAQYNQNSLYFKVDKHYSEVSYYANLAATEWSWATHFLDVDLDGYEDLIITTGYLYDYLDLDTQLRLNQKAFQSMQPIKEDLTLYPPLLLNNKIYHNNTDNTFSDKSKEWGFDEQDVAMGMAVADFDNDGDPDIAINRLNDIAAIYENKSNAPRIGVKLQGIPPNTDGIGAKIILKGAGGIRQSKEMVVGGTYVSSSQPMVFFAADQHNFDHTLKVIWRNGQISVTDSVRANRIYIIKESESRSQKIKNKIPETNKVVPLFKDVSNKIAHTHHENDFDDYAIQELLPTKLSQKGPGVTWFDIEADNDDDLLVSSGKGGRLAIFENLGQLNFRRLFINGITQQTRGDQTTVLGWKLKGNLSLLVVGIANYESLNNSVPSVYYYILDKKTVIAKDSIPGYSSSIGALTAADYDGDNDIDLFIGGNFKGGKYPSNADSKLYKYEKGEFVLDKKNSLEFSAIGLVAGAVFSDIDTDGDQDLILSREWDSIKIFRNDNANFVDITKSMGLHKYKGWWRGVATGDFNNDGYPDLVATNIGKNSEYQLDTDKPLRLFYDDLNRDGYFDIIDSFYSHENRGYVPRKQLQDFRSIPLVYQFIGSYRDFSSSTIQDIFRNQTDTMKHKEINTLGHMIFINKKGVFRAVELPDITQFTASYHPLVADFNNDGYEDLLLSQNQFTFPSNVSHLDAGCGIILMGNGDGTFKVLKPQESGIDIHGEQRGAAASDINGDHRLDLAISQNNGSTKLYLNQTEKKGIKIELVGKASNPKAIGSSVRLVFKGGRKGPIREIQAGSGYWSQEGDHMIMGYTNKPLKLEIKWYDNTSQTVNLDPHSTDFMKIIYD